MIMNNLVKKVFENSQPTEFSTFSPQDKDIEEA